MGVSRFLAVDVASDTPVWCVVSTLPSMEPDETDIEADDPFVEQLRRMVMAAIADDWASLSVSAERVADRVATALAPVMGAPEDEPVGTPWSAR